MSLLFSRLKYSSIPFVIAGVAFKFAHCQWQSAHVQGVHKKVIIYRDIGICVYRLITYQKGKKKRRCQTQRESRGINIWQRSILKTSFGQCLYMAFCEPFSSLMLFS